MVSVPAKTLGVVVLGAACLCAQNKAPAGRNGSEPLYQVTVVEQGLDAVNYPYGAAPTKIDFRGTVLLSDSKGQATVQAKTGRTEIDARFENLLPPTRFGSEYLTYVLWALTPEGNSRNLGEVVPDASNHAHLRVTTDLPTFGMIVTAEPYSAVRQPGDVVVLQNHARPDTAGKIEPIQPKPELMPRGHYTWQVPAGPQPAANAPKVSMGRYEAMSELYQAQNAVAIAQAAHAERYAPEVFAAAQRALAEAQRLEASKAKPKLVIQNSREAAQSAEDARLIAERREQDEPHSSAAASGTATGAPAAGSGLTGGASQPAHAEPAPQPAQR